MKRFCLTFAVNEKQANNFLNQQKEKTKGQKKTFFRYHFSNFYDDK